jgi:hypothetical protein
MMTNVVAVFLLVSIPGAARDEGGKEVCDVG